MIRLKKIAAVLLLCLAVPMTVILSYTALKNQRYDIASLIVAIISTLAFILSFEKNSANGKLVTIIAVLVALSVAGRFVFAPIPFFKPVTAIVIIAGVYFGGESGYIVGAFSALISNFYFGQGPWTLFQMMVWGLIGLLSGLLAKYITKNRFTLSVWGILSGIVYSMTMDIWTTISMDGEINIGRYLLFVSSSLPVMAVYAVSNVVFLLLLARPMGRKIERLKSKYGISKIT